jgi:CHAT domain/WD domain, G-beta repeat
VTRDFEVEIATAGDGYRVCAQSAAGESGSVTVSFPFDDLTLDRQLQMLELALLRSSSTTRRLTSEQELPVQQFGRTLFEFVFPAEVRAQLIASRQQAAQEGDPLRVRLRVDPPELAALPWEFLYDPGRDDYLCLSTPLVRYVDVLEPRRPMTVTPPLRILAMVARPDELDPLDIDRERELLTEAVAGLQTRGRVQLRWVVGQTWWDLQAALDAGEWHVLHFIGHGAFDPTSGEGVLGLAAEGGGVHRLAASDLGLLLESHRSLRLVVLNSCDTARASAADRFSSTASVLMRRGVPAVVAMQYEITDTAAISFARGLYTALAVRLPVDEAVTRARRAIKLSRPNTLEWATPVLYLRAPTGALFDLAEPGDVEPGDREPVDARSVDAQPAEARSVDAEPRRGPPDAGSAPGTVLIRVAHEATVRDLAFSPDGARLATASRDGVVRIIEAVTGEESTRLSLQAGVFGVAFCPGGTRVAAASADTAQLWCLGADRPLRTFVHDDRVWGLAFSPDGTLLLTAGHDHSARLWDASTGHELARYLHDGPVAGVAFSSNGARVATASDDRTASVWDVVTGRLVARVAHGGAVAGVVFGPHGDAMATAGGDGLVRVWNPSNGVKLAELSHDGPVHGVAFHPSGTTLASASHDRTVRLWHPSSRSEVVRLPHDGGVWSAAFSPDGSRLATGSHDRLARIWKL